MRPILSDGIINDKTNGTQLENGLCNNVTFILYSDILFLTYAII